MAYVLKTKNFSNGGDLEQTLMLYVALYNPQLHQSAFKCKIPMTAMKDWYASQTHFFINGLTIIRDATLKRSNAAHR